MVQKVHLMAFGMALPGSAVSAAPTAANSEPRKEKAAARSAVQKPTNFPEEPETRKGANAPGSDQ